MGLAIASAAGAAVDGRIGSLLVLASVALYAGGVALNDVFDLAEDRRERPFRPIPSGQIPVRTASVLGASLLTLGIALAWIVGTTAGAIASALTGLVLAYNAGLKRTAVGPVAMGGCRAVNVLLGASPLLAGATADQASLPAWLAVGNGVYISGVTLFARHEAGDSPRGHLANGLAVTVAGLVIHGVSLWQDFANLWVWPALGGFAIILVTRFAIAIRTPGPEKVQAAVKTGVLGIVAMDAILALGWAGVWPAALIAALLGPTLLLGRWVYST